MTERGKISDEQMDRLARRTKPLIETVVFAILSLVLSVVIYFAWGFVNNAPSFWILFGIIFVSLVVIFILFPAWAKRHRS